MFSKCFGGTSAFNVFSFGAVAAWEGPTAEHWNIQLFSPGMLPGSTDWVCFMTLRHMLLNGNNITLIIVKS